MSGNNPTCFLIYSYGHSQRDPFVENTTTLSASTNIVLETNLEARLKLQGWIIMASFENMESHTKDQVTNGHTQKQGKNLFKMSI